MKNGNVRTMCCMAVFTVVMLAMVLAGMSKDAPAAEPKRGHSLTVGLESQFHGFNVLKARTLNISGKTAIYVIMERLFDMDDKRNLIPVLGVSATPSDDGKTWTIKLRKGVTFHDGSRFDADAVVHHWKHILNPKNRYSGRFFIKPIQSIEKVDGYTVRFHLAHTWIPFLSVISNTTLSGFIPSSKAVEKGTHHRAPVGTGPFMFKEWKSGERFVVVRNPDYWQKGKPYLDKIVFLPLPDTQTRFASLKSGEVDVIWTDRGNTIRKAMKDKSIKTHKSDANGAMIMLLNNSKAPLDNPNVRQAMAHAWNQALYVKMSYKDTIPVVQHPFGNTLTCDDVGYRDYDVKKAKQLIKECGKPVEVEVVHTSTARGRELYEVIRQLYKEIGITVKSTPVDLMQMIKRVFTNNYQIAGWRIPPYRDLGPMLFGNFFSKSPYNVSLYNSPEMDRLLLEQRTTGDPEKRKAILCDIARLINEDAPVLYCGGRRIHAFSRPEVKGIPQITDDIVRLSEVWLDK